MLNLRELKQTYTDYNEKYFDGALPPVGKVTIEYSNRMTSSAGVCYSREKVIRLSQHYAVKWGDEELVSVLLHEMIHLQIPNHGKKFYAKMNEIKSKGGDVNRYSKGASNPKWRYTCRSCGREHNKGRRLSNGGKHHVCGKCKGKLAESKL